MQHRKAFPLVICALIVLTQAPAQSVITTLAGADWLFPGNGLPAVNAPLSGATYGLDVAVDQTGNLYIADSGNFEVFRVGTDGILTVIAGSGILGATGDGGLAISAALYGPTSVAVDTAGNVYIGGFGGDIRKVTVDGLIHTIAGNPFNPGFSGDGGPAVRAQLNGVYGLKVDSSGDIFITDTNNNRIREITPDGIIHTIAGTGTAGFGGDGGSATSAQLVGPTRLALDSAGNLYVTDGPSVVPPVHGRVRKVDSKGIITTVAGGGRSLSDNVQAVSAEIRPQAIAIDPAGNLYIADAIGFRIREVNLQGVLSTIAGGTGAFLGSGFSGDGGPASQAAFSFDQGAALAFYPAGNVLFADNENSRIRKFPVNGQINTDAGNGLYHFSGNNGPAASATIDNPLGIAGDSAGNIYFAEAVTNRIRRIAPDGAISVFAGTGIRGYSGDGGPATSATLSAPYFLAIAPDSSIAPAGSLVFSERDNCVIRAIDLSGNVSTIAGTAGVCTPYNGENLPALQTNFNEPAGIAFDSAGNLFVAEIEGNRVREIFATGSNKGTVQTVAGNGSAGYSGDGGAASNAQVYAPAGVKAHGTGLYFCEYFNHVVRFVDLSSGIITTVAGNQMAGYSGDGGQATKASLTDPAGLVFDAPGNLYIADDGDTIGVGSIRKVDSNGIITTFAGTLNPQGLGDGGSPINANLYGANDLFFDAAGDLIFTQALVNVAGRVREILAAPPTPTFQLNPSQLAFTAAAGSQPQNQVVNLTSLLSGSPVTVTTSSAWLSVSSTSAQLPASLQVTVDPSSLAAGTYQGTVTIASPYASPSSYPIAVTLTVTAAGQPSLSVSPTGLTFAFVQQAASLTRPITVSNVGGGVLSFSAQTTTTSGGSWLRVSTSSGSISAFGSTALNVTADPTGLSPGTYSGVITISTTTIPVTMTVSAVSQTILIPQTGLSFYAVQGGGSPPAQFFNILNTGSGVMPWTISTNTISGGQWLSAFPQSGQTDASVRLVPIVDVEIDPTGLNAGTYFGTVQVSAPGATNSPQFVSIVLTVLPAGSQIGPIVQPTGLIFAGLQGAEAPGAQSVTIQSTSSTPVSFTSSQATISGFTTLPTAGAITPTQPQEIVIQPNLTGLAPGVYRGTLTLSFSDRRREQAR